MVNQFRYGHQSAGVDFLRPSRVAGTMYTFNQWTMPIYNAFAQGRNSPVNEFTDNLTKINGNHTFKMGGQARFTTQDGYNAAGIYPNASLSTTLSGNTPSIRDAGRLEFEPAFESCRACTTISRAGSARYAQTFYSNLQSWQAAGTPRVRDFSFHEYGLFLQDDWKVNRNLTLNLGIRWDFSGVPTEANGLSGAFDQAGALNTVSTIDNLSMQKGKAWYNNDWNNFAPRFGFAWDPKGDGKTAIRGNYGIFYDRIIGATTSSVDGNTPGFSQAVTVFPNLGGLTCVQPTIRHRPRSRLLPSSPCRLPGACRSFRRSTRISAPVTCRCTA